MTPRADQGEAEDPALMKAVAGRVAPEDDNSSQPNANTGSRPGQEEPSETGARKPCNHSKRQRRDTNALNDDDLMEIPAPVQLARRSSSGSAATVRTGGQRERPVEASSRRISSCKIGETPSDLLQQDDQDLELMKVVASRSHQAASDSSVRVACTPLQPPVRAPASHPPPLPPPEESSSSKPSRRIQSEPAKQELAAVGVAQASKGRVPGAYAEAPNPDVEDLPSQTNSVRTTQVVVDPAPLISATLVGEDDQEDDAEDPQPQQDREPTPTTDSQKKMHTILALVGIGLLVVLILLVILLMVFLLRKDNQPEEPFAGEMIPMPVFPQDEPDSDLDDIANRLFSEATLEAIQDDQASPQGRAYQWLLKDPEWPSYSEAQLKQRFALATFYYAMGGSWHLLHYGVHECDWAGLACRDGNNIASMVIVRNKLSGSLPAELFWLTSLRNLDFGLNRVSGTLPSQVALLTNLEVLKMDVNKLEGTLPSEIGLLTNLRFLNLRNNELSGVLPSTLGNIPGLKGLDLQNNLLSGSIPTELGQAKMLRKLDLTGNSMITGGIPSELEFVEDVLL